MGGKLQHFGFGFHHRLSTTASRARSEGALTEKEWNSEKEEEVCKAAPLLPRHGEI